MKRVLVVEDEEASRTLNLHITRLRKKLNLYNELKTLPKVGYVLEVQS